MDLPGEAGTIMHKMENMGNVELATVAFGQSFQITPIQLATTVSSIINGGRRITPHFGVAVLSADGTSARKLEYLTEEGVLSETTSQTVRTILESVVSEGSGRNARIEGISVGGKRQPPRHFQEAQTAIFLLFWDLCLLMILRYWGCVSSTTQRAFIMAEP